MPFEAIGLATSHMPDLWEVRTDRPDAVRLFGFFVDKATLVLTHGNVRDDVKDWKREASRAAHVKGKLNFLGNHFFVEASIDEYL